MNKEKKKLTKREKGLLIAFIISLVIMIFQTFALGLKTNNTTLKTTNETKRAINVQDYGQISFENRLSEYITTAYVEIRYKEEINGRSGIDLEYSNNPNAYHKIKDLFIPLENGEMIDLLRAITESQYSFDYDTGNQIYTPIDRTNIEYVSIAMNFSNSITFDKFWVSGFPIMSTFNAYGQGIYEKVNYNNANELLMIAYSGVVYPFQAFKFTLSQPTNFSILYQEPSETVNLNNVFDYAYNLGRDSVNGDIGSLEKQVENLTQQNNILQTQIEQLNHQIEEAQNGYSIANDIFTIADMPIQMIQQILNFNILGINLWAFLSAIITLLLGVWLIKLLI